MATMNTSEMIPVTLEFFLADGVTQASVQQDSIVWASSDETVVTATPDATNAATGFIRSVAVSVAPARVTFTADADMGAGVVTITAVTEDIDVTQDPATLANTIRVTLGAPVPKAQAPVAPVAPTP
jgi:predicted NUDIX family NTP pyrophosphohydrolase